MNPNGERLPEPTRRAVEDLRRLVPPGDLLRSVRDEAERTPQRRPWALPLRSALAGVVATAAVLAAVVLLPRLPGPGPGAGSSTVTSPPPDGAVDLRIAVPEDAHTGSADAVNVWLGSEASGRVIRYDAATGGLLGEVQVNDPTDESYDLWPVSDGSSVWAAGLTDTSVVRIDIATMGVAARWPIDGIPYRIAPAADAIWISDFDGSRVLEVDASNGRILGTVEVLSPTGIAVTPSAIYVVGYAGDLVVIDSVTRAVVAEHGIAGRATDLLLVDGDLLIWGLDGRLLERFDTTTSTIVATTGDVTAVALLDGQPWAALRDGSVALLDPATLASTLTIPLGDVSTDQLVASSGRLWAYAGTPSGTFLYGIRPER